MAAFIKARMIRAGAVETAAIAALAVTGAKIAAGTITADKLAAGVASGEFGVATELTIATGAITTTGKHHTVDTEADAASDDLDTISGVTEGEVVFLRPASAARTVVVKHGTGNIKCPGAVDISLAEATDGIWCVGDGTNVIVLSASTLAKLVVDSATLASVVNGKGASLVGIEDAATQITATTVEGALTEIVDASQALVSSLAATTNANGASRIGIEDAGSIITATTVEGALAEIMDELNNYRDQFVTATVACPNVAGGGTDAALTVSLKQARDNATDPTTICQLLIRVVAAENTPMQTLNGTTTFSAATVGAIVASGTGWALVTTDAAGDFACTLANSADEVVWIFASTAEQGVDVGKRCVVVACNPDNAEWTA